MDITHLRAKDIMKTDVIKVYASMTLIELAKLFEAERISGAPVVEIGEKLIGVVSETDLVREQAADTKSLGKEDIHPYFKDSDGKSTDGEALEEFEEFHISNEEKTVEDIMTPWTISVSEDTPVSDIAKTMVKQHVHRVLVTDKHFRLKGIISTMDLAQLVAEMEPVKNPAF